MTPRATAIMVILCIAANAQQFFEASGSTRVFTLAAGAKSEPAAVMATNSSTARAPAHLVVTVRHGVYIGAPGAPAGSKVSIYNIMGKRIEQIAIDNTALVPVSKNLPAGIYFARLEMNRRALSALCFRIVK